MYQAIAWEGHLNYLNNKIFGEDLVLVSHTLPGDLSFGPHSVKPVALWCSRPETPWLPSLVHVASAGAFQGLMVRKTCSAWLSPSYFISEAPLGERGSCPAWPGVQCLLLWWGSQSVVNASFVCTFPYSALCAGLLFLTWTANEWIIPKTAKWQLNKWLCQFCIMISQILIIENAKSSFL